MRVKFPQFPCLRILFICQPFFEKSFQAPITETVGRSFVRKGGLFTDFFLALETNNFHVLSPRFHSPLFSCICLLTSNSSNPGRLEIWALEARETDKKRNKHKKIYCQGILKHLYYQISQKQLLYLARTCPLCGTWPILPFQDIGTSRPTRCYYQMTPRLGRRLGKGAHCHKFCTCSKQASPLFLSG